MITSGRDLHQPRNRRSHQRRCRRKRTGQTVQGRRHPARRRCRHQRDPADDGPDADGDGLCDAGDLCPDDPDNDIDADDVCGDIDNCELFNPDQLDCQPNGVGDVCDIADGTSFDTNVNGVPDECDPCLGDLNGDGKVRVPDLLILLAAWGPNPGHPADLDGNGEVRVPDLIALLAKWGVCP